MRARLVGIVVVTVTEGPAVYLWLRLDEAGHEWWALLSVVVGEVLETVLAGLLIVRQRRAGTIPGAERVGGTHQQKLQRLIGAASVAEIGIWLLWLALADAIGQPVAAVVLLVAMHLKHHLEEAAIRDIPYTTGLFSLPGTVASAAEVAGAVACLALLRDGQPELAAVALGLGFLIEHTILVDILQRELESRDIRLPRTARP